MTTPVDLDALDALHAAGTAGGWGEDEREWSVDERIHEGEGLPTYDVLDVGRNPIAEDLTDTDAALIVALHSAYPALAAEVRRLRKVEAAGQEVLSAEAACDDELTRPPGGRSSAPLVRRINAMETLRAALAKGGDGE